MRRNQAVTLEQKHHLKNTQQTPASVLSNGMGRVTWYPTQRDFDWLFAMAGNVCLHRLKLLLQSMHDSFCIILRRLATLLRLKLYLSPQLFNIFRGLETLIYCSFIVSGQIVESQGIIVSLGGNGHISKSDRSTVWSDRCTKKLDCSTKIQIVPQYQFNKISLKQ